MNYTHIAGHLGADPETRFTSSGQKVTTLRVACRARKDETIWWKVTIWGDQFDKMLPYFKKGSPICIVGEMTKPEIFMDREGKPQISLQIIAHHISFSPFGKGKSGEESGSTHAMANPVQPSSTTYFNNEEQHGFEQNKDKSGSDREKANQFMDEEIPF